MSESTGQSDPVFIDVQVPVEQFPLNEIPIVIPDSPNKNVTNEILIVIPDTLNKNVKVEAESKTGRSSSPLATFLEIQPRRIRCKECNKYTAENEEKMLRHVKKVHRGENPFQCYLCDYSTYNKSLFEEHVRIHQGIKPFKCSHCPYRSASKKNTKKHELIHRPDNPHKCQQCGFIARHLKSLQCHLNAEHNQSKPITPCTYCKKKIVDIETHLKNLIKCVNCSKLFCTQSSFKKHMNSAHGNKVKMSKADFICAICKWSSSVKPRILLHLIHHPNQPVDENVVDVRILKECGIVGQGW